jgi:hypothetical protein
MKTSPTNYYDGICWCLEGWPTYLNGHAHSGIDLACRENDAMIAVEGGKVVNTGKGIKGEADFVSILGENTGYKYIYCHIESTLKIGDVVR